MAKSLLTPESLDYFFGVELKDQGHFLQKPIYCQTVSKDLNQSLHSIGSILLFMYLFPRKL